MESTSIVNIQSLEPYRHLFPPATGVDKTIKKGATVSDTVDFIPSIVSKTQWQVENFVNQELRGLSTYSACEKLWHFVKHHIRYKKDKRGVEQVRSPRRLIHDAAGDCDCFTTFIGTCLSVLKIPVINRITKYKENYFQHIYPIVPLSNGSYITMDCVVDRFNYEEPYTEKKDFKMDLEYLDGIEKEERLPASVDAQDLFGWDAEMGELGKLKLFKGKQSAMPEENQGGQGKKKGLQKFKQIAKRALNVVNKANPVTVLLRAGILASMKLNIMKVAQRLKWAYLPEAEAKKKGADMSKFKQLKNVLYKMEQIFYSAGGKPENLKKSILTGRGNRNKEVSGIDGYDKNDMNGMDENTPLSTLLGDIYHDEFLNGIEGTDGLGVVETAAIASATTVMGTIAALIKKLGNLFPNKKGGEAADFENVDTPDTPSASEVSAAVAESNATSNAPAQSLTSESSSNSTTGSTEKQDSGEEPKGLKAFWENNKKWIKPVGIGLTVVGAIYVGYRLIKSHKEKSNTKQAGNTNNGQAMLNGFSKGQHRKRKKGKFSKKSNIALM